MFGLVDKAGGVQVCRAFRSKDFMTTMLNLYYDSLNILTFGLYRVIRHYSLYIHYFCTTAKKHYATLLVLFYISMVPIPMVAAEDGLTCVIEATCKKVTTKQNYLVQPCLHMFSIIHINNNIYI